MTSLTGTIDVTPTEFPLSDKNSSIGASTLERLSPKNRLGGDIYVDVAT